MGTHFTVTRRNPPMERDDLAPALTGRLLLLLAVLATLTLAGAS